jgi:carboxylate-amine ligase
VFQAFPRAGLPRDFPDYASYVEAVDSLVHAHAIPEPTFIWWDLRLQPRLGTLELRAMDAQTRLSDTAALAAFVQCLVRLEALEGFAEPALISAPEVINENRFLATRDGMDAALLEPGGQHRATAAARLAELLEVCRAHADALGCKNELGLLAGLASDPGASRQRTAAREPGGMPALMKMLEREFPPVGDPVRRAGGLMTAV